MEIVKAIFDFFVVLFSNLYIDILLLLYITLRILYPKLRGFMGELWVKLELKSLPKEEYIILNNIMLSGENGTTQIDHLVVSQYGIFVIEMKNYYGLVLGNEYSDKWIQYIGKSKRQFQNPIRQNYGHTEALKNILNLNDNYFIPIVCFSNQTKLNVKVYKSLVVQLEDLVSLIKEYKSTVIISDINNISNAILKSSIKNWHIKKKHVSSIKNRIKENNKAVDNMICPRCGAKLIRRIGKYGEFIGCSNYPKCRFTK